MNRGILSMLSLLLMAASAFAQAQPKAPAPTPAPAPAAAPVKLLREVAVGPDLLCVAAIPATAKAYAGGTDGKIYFIDFDEAKPNPTKWDAHVSYISGLAFTGKHLISAGSDYQLTWWDVETKAKVRSLEAHGKKWIRGVALSPDGKTLASVGDDMVCRLWDAESGKPIRELAGHDKLTPYGLNSKLYCCRFSPDGKHLATGDQAGVALVWEVASGKQVGRIHAPHLYTADTNGHTYGGIRALAFSPDGALLAVAGNLAGDTSTITGSKALVQLYDWKENKQTHDFPIKINGFFESICFHPKEPWLIAAVGAGEGKKVVILDLQKKAALHEFLSNIHVFDIALNGTTGGADALIAVGRKKAMRWQLQTGGAP